MCQRALPQPLPLEEGQAADQILSRSRAVHNLFLSRGWSFCLCSSCSSEREAEEEPARPGGRG